MTDATAALTIRSLSKTFAGVKALDDIDVELRRGRVTALLGMNGSGKSTLIKILAGIYDPDAGATLTVHGRDVPLPLTPAVARHSGLRFLHQDVGLVDALTVADNFGLVDGFPRRALSPIVRSRTHAANVRSACRELGLEIDPDTVVSTLSQSAKTMVGVARALFDPGERTTTDHKVLVLDEPTASLPQDEVEDVLQLVERLRDAGETIVYVSHRIDEIRRIGDDMIVLRDGRLITSRPIGESTPDEIVAETVGFDLRELRRSKVSAAGESEVLTLHGISGQRVDHLDLTVRAGEVVGIAGLTGCGRSELLRLVSGAQKHTSGQMTLDNQPYHPSTPSAAIGHGVALVPEHRRRDGVVLDMTVAENISLGRLSKYTRWGFLRGRAERDDAKRLIDEFSLSPRRTDLPVASLSGGNQQKVVLGKVEQSATRVLALDEPTQGVDAAVKLDIVARVRRYAAQGGAVLIGSSENRELADTCDRVIVLDRGRVVAELAGEDLTEERIIAACARSAESTDRTTGSTRTDFATA